MQKLEQQLRVELQRLKAFEINRIKRLEKRQKQILERLVKELNLNTWLTEKEVIVRFKLSRTTLYRYRTEGGLKYHKNSCNGKIRYKKREVEKFLTKNS